MSIPVILFVCVHNGGRSLAAKVLAEHHAGGTVEVRSAASEPGEALNPVVVQVLHDRGLRTDGERPTLLTPDDVQAADVVVTMGCGETCPVFPGTTYEDWALEDPKGQDLNVAAGSWTRSTNGSGTCWSGWSEGVDPASVGRPSAALDRRRTLRRWGNRQRTVLRKAAESAVKRSVQPCIENT